MTELTGMRGLTADELELVNGAGAGEVAAGGVLGAALGAVVAAGGGAVLVAFTAGEVVGVAAAAVAVNATK